MFGLLNLDDEQRYGLLMAAAQAFKGGPGGTGANVGRALEGGLLGYQTARGAKDRRLEEAQQREARDLMMQQQRQQIGDQNQVRGIFQQNSMPGNLAPNDDEGNPMPAAPQGMNMEGLQRGLMSAGPAGFQAMQQFGLGPQAPQFDFAPNGQLIDKRDPSNRGQSFAPTPKPVFQPGQTRELKSGRRIFTQEYQPSGEWKTISQSSMDAPDKPDKPEKAPAGYKWDGDKLSFIPGGPADPASGRKNSVPTEDERRSAGLAIRMENAIQTMGKFPDAGKPEILPTAIRAASGGNAESIPNALTSTSRQQVEAAQLDALDAALTLATGAAYTKDQLKNLSKSYFPQIGDRPETVRAKEENLKKVIQTARIRAGRAEGDIGRVNGGASGGWGIKAID